MKPLIPGLTIAIAALCTISPTFGGPAVAPRLLNSGQYDPSTIGSITIGSQLEQVRRAFGRLADESDGSSFCIDADGVRSEGMAKTLFYPGFTVTLAQGESGYVVLDIAIRSSNLWVTPGLSVGMSAQSLKSFLGKPDLTAVDGNSGGRVWHYAFESPAGDLRIHLSHGVVTLIEIRAEGVPCGLTTR